jgi:hypothetical protein
MIPTFYGMRLYSAQIKLWQISDKELKDDDQNVEDELDLLEKEEDDKEDDSTY